MRKNKNSVAVNEISEKEKLKVEEAKRLVLVASEIVGKLGPVYQRVSWLLEDSLIYLDQAMQKSKVAIPKQSSSRFEEELEKLLADTGS